MEQVTKPYVQLVVDGIDTVVLDAEGAYDAELHDRYATFEQARDAAMCCIEYALEDEDDADPAHRAGLESMLRRLEMARSIEDLEGQAEVHRHVSARTAA